MSCTKVQEQIPSYLEDLLSEPQRKEIRDHFADCERCADYSLKQTNFTSDLRRLTTLEPVFDLNKIVLEAFIASRDKKERKWPVIAALVLLAMILFLVWQRGKSSLAPVPVAEEPPAPSPSTTSSPTPKMYLEHLENIESILTEVSAALEEMPSPSPDKK